MSIKHLLIFVIAFQGVISDEYVPDFRKVLSTFLVKMAYLRLELRTDVSSDFDNGYVQFLLRQRHCPIVVSTYSLNEIKNPPNPAENFAIVSDMKHLAGIVDYFAEPDGTFFFIVTDEFDLREVDRILRRLWYSKGIIQTLVLAANKIVFYDPFVFDENTQKFGDVSSLGNRDLSHLFEDLKGYPLRVQLFKSVYSQPVFDAITKQIVAFERADAMVAKALEERMNFRMILQEPSKDYFGERFPNGSYNGAIGMIMKGETDITLTGFFVKDYLVRELQFTVAVYDDQLCCYVHKAPRIPQAIMPIVALRWDFWLGFIISAFACGTIWVLIRRINLWITVDEFKKLHLSKHLRYQFIRIYIDTWVVWVRVNIVRYPPFTSERIFILSLCLVSVISGAIIESSLATVYIHPMYYKDINTLQELDDSGLKIVYKYTSFKDDLFFSETSHLFAALNKKLVHLQDLNADVMHDVAHYGGIVGVTRYSSLMLESINWILADKVHVVKECPKYYMIAYVMPKDSPFADRVNSLLLRFLNAGLINKWIKDMHDKANMIVMKEQVLEERESFKILTLVDLQLAFYVVILGSLLSAISLGIEVLIKRRKTTQMVAKHKFQKILL